MSITLPSTVSEDQLHLEVARFYARHLQLLDDGDVDEWAATCTDDCAFLLPGMTEPVRGRQALAAAVRKVREELAAKGERQRHLHVMTTVTPREDGTFRARSYGLVISTQRGGDPRLHRMCVCEDVLVRTADGWQVQSRRVTRDDQ